VGLGGEGELGAQELRRRSYERLSDWSEPGAVKINRGGKLVEPAVVPDQTELPGGKIYLTDGCKEHMI